MHGDSFEYVTFFVRISHIDDDKQIRIRSDTLTSCNETQKMCFFYILIMNQQKKNVKTELNANYWKILKLLCECLKKKLRIGEEELAVLITIGYSSNTSV